VLYLFLQLDEAERIAHLQEESREIQRAFRMNMAFANPEALRQERDRHELALATDPRAMPITRQFTRDELREAALALFHAGKPKVTS
jgi:hypothetical protein